MTYTSLDDVLMEMWNDGYVMKSIIITLTAIFSFSVCIALMSFILTLIAFKGLI